MSPRFVLCLLPTCLMLQYLLPKKQHQEGLLSFSEEFYERLLHSSKLQDAIRFWMPPANIVVHAYG